MATYIIKTAEGSKIFICGKKKDLGPHCEDCLGFAENLCDFKIGKRKMCNRKVCEDHGHEVGENKHYCTAHFNEHSDNM